MKIYYIGVQKNSFQVVAPERSVSQRSRRAVVEKTFLDYYMDDDSMRLALVKALRARGVDVLTALDIGMINRADNEHLDYAAAQGRVLFSFNTRDFYELHTRYLTTSRSHAGMILARQQAYSVGELMRRILHLMNARSAEEMIDQVEFLGGWG